MAVKPNILLVTAHDIGRHLGCYGVEEVHTPNLDNLAAQGVRFAQAYCTAPQCSPSRSSIFTGRWPHNNGVMGLTHSYFAWDLHDDERHLAAQLGAAGWATAVAGVIHETAHPEKLGFDRIICRQIDNAFALNEQVSAYLRDDRPPDQPFYLQVGYFEPHRAKVNFGTPPDTEHGVKVPPYLVNEPSARHSLAHYQGAIRQMDEAFGALLATLDELNLTDNTLVIFTADHGIPYPRAKCSLYDAGLEVALIMRWQAGMWQPGSVIDGLVSSLDLTPTLLDLFGLPIAENIQGQSFLPLLKGEAASTRNEIFAEMTYHNYTDPRRCIRTTTHKLIVNFTVSYSFMDPSQQWRPNTITHYPANPAYSYHVPVELYDLERDPLEMNNLALDADHAALRGDLLARLYAWMQDTNDPLLEGIPTPPMHDFALRALRGEGIEVRGIDL